MFLATYAHFLLGLGFPKINKSKTCYILDWYEDAITLRRIF